MSSKKKLSRSEMFRDFNDIIDRSRLNVFNWVTNACLEQIQYILNEVEESLPALMEDAKTIFRWRISDEYNESSIWYRDITYPFILEPENRTTKPHTGKLKGTIKIKDDGARILQIDVSGETSFLRGYETINDKTKESKPIMDRVYAFKFNSNYGFRLVDFALNSNYHGFVFEVSLDENNLNGIKNTNNTQPKISSGEDFGFVNINFHKNPPVHIGVSAFLSSDDEIALFKSEFENKSNWRDGITSEEVSPHFIAIRNEGNGTVISNNKFSVFLPNIKIRIGCEFDVRY